MRSVLISIMAHISAGVLQFPRCGNADVALKILIDRKVCLTVSLVAVTAIGDSPQEHRQKFSHMADYNLQFRAAIKDSAGNQSENLRSKIRMPAPRRRLHPEMIIAEYFSAHRLCYWTRMDINRYV